MCGYRQVSSWFWPWLHLWCCSLGYESWVLINPCILGVVPSSQSKTWWLYDSIMVLVQRTRTTHLICGVAALDGIISIKIFVILCVSDSRWSSVAQCSTYPVWDSTHHSSHLVCCCDAQNVLPKCSHRNAESAGRDQRSSDYGAINWLCYVGLIAGLHRSSWYLVRACLLYWAVPVYWNSASMMTFNYSVWMDWMYICSSQHFAMFYGSLL